MLCSKPAFVVQYQMSSLFLDPLCTTQDFSEIQFPPQHIELGQIPSPPHQKKYAILLYLTPPLTSPAKQK